MEGRTHPINNDYIHDTRSGIRPITIECSVSNVVTWPAGSSKKPKSRDLMIRECPHHGFYADDHLCPACNAEGKFIKRIMKEIALLED